jgi:hypothetical protein
MLRDVDMVAVQRLLAEGVSQRVITDAGLEAYQDADREGF